jgi:adenylate kinase
MNLVLIGPQGSGKGTQAELLAKKLKLPVIGIGRLFRQEVQNKTKLGQKVGKFMNQGLLVPEQFTEELLKIELNKSKYKQGAIYDGFPRDYKQLKLLEKLIAVDYVIFIGISQQESIRRLSSRRVCSCGETYNISTEKPRHGLICDKCSKKLRQRADDTLIKINGAAPVKEVFNLILKDLRNKKIC